MALIRSCRACVRCPGKMVDTGGVHVHNVTHTRWSYRSMTPTRTMILAEPHRSHSPSPPTRTVSGTLGRSACALCVRPPRGEDVRRHPAPRVDPAHPGEGLALGTVAIATRVVAQDLGATPGALRHGAAQGRRATRRDRLHRPPLLPREVIRGAIGLAVGTKAIGDFGSAPWASLGVGVVTPGTADEIVGHPCVNGTHEGRLDRPSACGSVRSSLR
jgi:hypothetical protein